MTTSRIDEPAALDAASAQAAAMEERHAAVGKLAARVAHELNNPLDGILRYVNLTLRLAEKVESPKITEYLLNIRTGILRMAQIVAALLEFSRSAPELPERSNLNTLVEDAIRTFEGRLDTAKITVACRLTGESLPAVRGVNLFQIFCNVVKNAIDAMPNGGALDIETTVQQTDAVITFADTGVGLPEEVERIFEAFYTTKEPGKGTGLGLAVCRELIAGYGGRIEAQRRRPRGSVFIIRIPLCNLETHHGSRHENSAR